MLPIVNRLWIFSDSRPDVLPHRLPTAHSWRQQLRVGWANPTGTSPDAPSISGGCGWEPPPSSIPTAGTWKGGLQGWAAYPTDGSHFLRYMVWSHSFLVHFRAGLYLELTYAWVWIMVSKAACLFLLPVIVRPEPGGEWAGRRWFQSSGYYDSKTAAGTGPKTGSRRPLCLCSSKHQSRQRWDSIMTVIRCRG